MRNLTNSLEEQSYVLISLQQDHNFVRMLIQPRENCFSSFSMITNGRNVVLSLGLIEFLKLSRKNYEERNK